MKNHKFFQGQFYGIVLEQYNLQSGGDILLRSWELRRILLGKQTRKEGKKFSSGLEEPDLPPGGIVQVTLSSLPDNNCFQLWWMCTWAALIGLSELCFKRREREKMKLGGRHAGRDLDGQAEAGLDQNTHCVYVWNFQKIISI